jgi:hypothetical protein
MQTEMRERFVNLWDKHFPKSELPIAFYYTDEGPAERACVGGGGGQG